MVICFLTVDDILERALLKDMTKGVRPVLWFSCSCGWSVALRGIARTRFAFLSGEEWL